MSRPLRCSARPTAMKPTARTTIAMIAQITTRAVSQIGRIMLSERVAGGPPRPVGTHVELS